MNVKYISLGLSTLCWSIPLARVGLASDTTPIWNAQGNAASTATYLENSTDDPDKIDPVQNFKHTSEFGMQLRRINLPSHPLNPDTWNDKLNRKDKNYAAPTFSVNSFPNLTINSSVCSTQHSSFLSQSISTNINDLAIELSLPSSSSYINTSTNIPNTASDLLPLRQLQAQNTETEIDRRLDDPPYPFPDDLEIDESGGQLPLAVIRPVPVLQLQLESAILTNSDVSATSILEDSAFINSLALQATPALGSNTRLTAGVGADLIRFASGNGYNQLAATLGILQELGDNMSLRIVGGYRQTYGVGVQFEDDLTEYSARLGLTRVDQLGQKLSLYSSDELQISFAEAESQSRITNSLRLGLSYDFTSELQGALGYRFVYEDFTESPRTTASHQLSAQTSYQFNQDLSLAFSVSYLFGDSFDLLRAEERNLNNISVGLYLRYNIPLLF